MLKASKNNQLKPISSVTFSTLSAALNLKNVPGLASILGVISQTCFLYPSTPRTRPSHSEPPASRRRDASEMRQTCKSQNTSLWAGICVSRGRGVSTRDWGKRIHREWASDQRKGSKVASLDMAQLSKFRTFLEMRPNSTVRLQSCPTAVRAGRLHYGPGGPGSSSSPVATGKGLGGEDGTSGENKLSL